MQDIEVELLPTFIVYFKSDYCHHTFQKALEPDGHLSLQIFLFTKTIFVKEELTPLLSNTVNLH
jgi:hypothetical protein